MVRKHGIDIRSNWVFYNDSLLTVETLPAAEIVKTKLTPVTPDELRDIIDQNHEAIHDAGEALYAKTLERRPNAKIYYPWLHVIKLATYADAFRYGLTEEAEALEPTINANSNNNYPRQMIREEHHPYLDAVDELPFAWRVSGRMNGWNLARDGLWLQIKSRRQFNQDMGRYLRRDAKRLNP